MKLMKPLIDSGEIPLEAVNSLATNHITAPATPHVDTGGEILTSCTNGTRYSRAFCSSGFALFKPQAPSQKQLL